MQLRLVNEKGFYASRNGHIFHLTNRRGLHRMSLKCRPSGYVLVVYSRAHFCQWAHRLVAMAWCPGYEPGRQVDHINRIRHDNRADNLRWVTPRENACGTRHVNKRWEYIEVDGRCCHNTCEVLATGCIRSPYALHQLIQKAFASPQLTCTYNGHHIRLHLR